MSKILKAVGALQMNLGDNPEISDGALNQILQDPARAGREFLMFLRNGARVMIGGFMKLVIDHSQKFNMAEFIGAGWTIWKGAKDGDGLSGKEDVDKRALGLTEVDLSSLILEENLKPGETNITGEEKLIRLMAGGNIQLGAEAALALWRDYQENGENSRLEWLRRNRKITWLSFFGTRLRSPRGFRYVLCLCWYGGQWFWDCRWLGYDWRQSNPSGSLVS